MPRNRWSKIYQYISCDVNDLTEYLNTQAKRYWLPFSHVSMDETLLAFKGRYRYWQHIRGKPNATGLKVIVYLYYIYFT